MLLFNVDVPSCQPPDITEELSSSKGERFLCPDWQGVGLCATELAASMALEWMANGR